MLLARSWAAGGRLDRVRRWGPKVGFSILDQALISGANFVLNVLLARWLSLGEYGAFSVAFTVFLVLSGLHTALLLEPISVLGVAYRGDRFPEYLGSVTLIHAGLTVALSITILAAAQFIGDWQLQDALRGLALSLPLILSMWLLRRVYYLETRPGAAAVTSAIYAIIVVVGFICLTLFAFKSPLVGFIAMGIACLFASGVGLKLRLLREVFEPGSKSVLQIWFVLKEHWDYGRWLVLTAMLSLATTQVQMIFAAALTGLEGAGTLRAISSFAVPMVQATIAIATLGLPILAREFQQGNPTRLRQLGSRITLGLVAVALMYGVVLFLVAEPLERTLYDGKFAESIWLIPIFGLLPIFGALANGYALIARAMRRSDLILVGSAATAPVAVLTSLLFTRLWGVGGAAMSLLLAYVFNAAVMYYLYRSRLAEVNLPIGGGSCGGTTYGPG